MTLLNQTVTFLLNERERRKKKTNVSFIDFELELKRQNLFVKIIMAKFSVVKRILPLSSPTSKRSPLE